MRLDLLWWRHLRPPRPHVAEEFSLLSKERVIDMRPLITVLDPDTTAFTTMLMRMNGGRELVVDPGAGWDAPIGSFIEDVEDGRLYRVAENEPFRPDDWLDARRRVVLVRKDSPKEITHYWLEDELFPRLKEMP